MNKKSKQIKNENLIHVKLEYEEALRSKKNILSSEMNLLKVIKIIKKYCLLREKELKDKLKLNKKVKETKNNIKKIQIILPKLKIPKRLKKEDAGLREIKKKYDENLELQLQEIRKKLKSLAS